MQIPREDSVLAERKGEQDSGKHRTSHCICNPGWGIRPPLHPPNLGTHDTVMLHYSLYPLLFFFPCTFLWVITSLGKFPGSRLIRLKGL